MEENKQNITTDTKPTNEGLESSSVEVSQKQTESKRVDSSPPDLSDFAVEYLDTIQSGLEHVAEKGINETVATAVYLFLGKISARDEATAVQLATAFGLGVMLCTAMLQKSILDKPELLKKVGWEYTAAAINILWPDDEIEPAKA